MKSLRSLAFWNWPISQLDDNYIVIVIGCLINIVYGSWEIKGAAINTGLSYALLAFVCLYPVCMQTFLYKKRDKLKQSRFARNFKSTYEFLDERDNRFLLYPLFSFYRRLFVSISIILLPTTFIAQYFVVMISVIAMIMLIGYKSPFKEASRNTAQLVYESYIVFFVYHILCFTDFVIDTTTKNYVGYSAITCLALHILYFYIAVLYFAVKGLIRSCRRSNSKKKAKEKAQLDISRCKSSARKIKLRREKRIQANAYHRAFMETIGYNRDAA